MKVELSIKDDTQLRNVIKDMIRSQVTSIIRDELQALVKYELEKQFGKIEEKVKNDISSEYKRFNTRIKEYLDDKILYSVIKELIISKDITKITKDYIKDYLYDELPKLLKIKKGES